jgi:hypothetical protein
MAWQAKPSSRQRGIWTLVRDGQEVGTFSLLTDLQRPATVLAAICAALDADEPDRAAA